MRNGTKTQSATVYCVFLWVDILDAGCFRPSVSNLMTSPSWYIPESTLKIPHTSWSNRSSCAICKSWSHVFCKEVAMPSPHPPSPQKQPWQPSACGPAWARLEKPWRRPCLHLPRPTCPGFYIWAGKRNLPWKMRFHGGGRWRKRGWRVTGDGWRSFVVVVDDDDDDDDAGDDCGNECGGSGAPHNHFKQCWFENYAALVGYHWLEPWTQEYHEQCAFGKTYCAKWGSACLSSNMVQYINCLKKRNSNTLPKSSNHKVL